MTHEDTVRRDFPSARVRSCERRGGTFYTVGVLVNMAHGLTELVWTPWWKTPERAWEDAARKFCRARRADPC